jgi:apolipoprotein D and lipocalin family protein
MISLHSMSAFLLTVVAVTVLGQNKPVSTVAKVDLSRYVGLWHEIAKIPNSFQRKCTCNTTASYMMRDDGRIEVVNRCEKSDGTWSQAKGVARVVDELSNAKLQVSFVNLVGYYLFWGDYWIIGLDEHYQYAVIGHPNRKYGWILSRKTELTDVEKKSVLQILTDQGYNPDRFEWTIHKP